MWMPVDCYIPSRSGAPEIDMLAEQASRLKSREALRMFQLKRTTSPYCLRTCTTPLMNGCKVQ